MFSLRLIVLAFLASSTLAQAQWVTSGSGMGSRTGDQGLTNADGAAQSLGYADNAALEAASLLGYEPTSEDGALWTAATSGVYNEDCRILFGADCDEVTDDIFRPQKPITQAALGLGFTGSIEQDSYLAVCGGLPDAQRCKQKGYAPTQGDASLCQMSVTDTDNLEFCQARPGNASGDCSDLPREDYEAIVMNNAPQIVLPADWTPPSLSTGDSPRSEIFQFSAVDADGDPLTWSVRDTNGVFNINGQGMLSLAAALTTAGQNLHSAEVKVSDGIAFDVETVRFDVTHQNRPPRIIAPQDWMPSEVARNTNQGAVLVSALAATDPDNDPLSWTIAASDLDIFAINSQTGTLTLARPNGLQGFADRPETVSVTVQVSDGTLTDDYDLVMRLEEPNGAPQIIVPDGWQPAAISSTARPGDELISQLSATDPNDDELTWSIANMDFDVFQIDPQSAVVSLFEGNNVPEESPDSITLTVQVSDGELTDELTLKLDVEDPNRPPQIIVPADWMPSIIAHDAEQGAELINVLAAQDPDGDELTWSIAASDLDILAIDPATGVMTLSRENGLAGLEERPENISLTVRVSDGDLTDEQALVIPLEAEKGNNPPEIIVPEGFAGNELAPYADQNTQVGSLEGRDPDGDTLTWTLLGASPQIFAINADTGTISYNGLGGNDKLACEATAGDAATPKGSSSAASQTTSERGIVSVNANVIQDHGSSDFRSKRAGGSFSTSGKYHVVLERANHRGGSFTTESRSATTYSYESGSISVPGLSATSINSNLSPINSYLVFQNNSQADLRGVNGQVTFENPIVGIFYSDSGFDNTINSLGKPGAQYSRKYQQSKLGLENGRDIAWIDPVDRRVLNFRSRTAGIGDFIRVITTASNATDNGDENTEPSGPDTCTATLTVQLSDGQETDEETLTLAFGDPNRAPEIIFPADWVPSPIANDRGPNDSIVSVMAARDPDGDTLLWSLSGEDAALFSINERNGAISLSEAWNDLGTRPAEAKIIVSLSDGRLADTSELTFAIEEAEAVFADVSFGLSGKAAFVGGGAPIAAPFNGTYTIFTRFYKGDQGMSDYEWLWKKGRYKRQKIHVPQTIFSHNDADVSDPNDYGDATHLYIRNGRLAIKIGSNQNHNITATNRPVGRGWHTAMIVVDREGVHQKAGCKSGWPVKSGGSGWPVKKFYLDGTLLPLSKPHINKQQTFLYPGCQFSGQIRANRFLTLGVGDGYKLSHYADYNSHRVRPLHPSHGLHEVTIWAGDMSQHKNEIMTAGQGANYPEVGVPMPVYWWKPGLIGEAETANGEVTMTVPNLVNGAGPGGRPLAGDGRTREAGDMHLYAGRFKLEKISGNDWRAVRDQDLDHLRKYGHVQKIIGLWHQGMTPRGQAFNGYFDVNALPQFKRQDGDADEAYRDRIRNEIRKFGLRDLN